MAGVDQDRNLWVAVRRYRATERGFDQAAGWLHPATERALEELDATICVAELFGAIASVAGHHALEARLAGIDLRDEDDRAALRVVVDDVAEAVRSFDALLTLAEDRSS